MTVYGPGAPKYGRGGRPIRKKTTRKRTKKTVKASCDRLWSQAVRSCAGWHCERCGTTPEAARGFHAHHVYSRSNHRLRFELRNGMAVCATCHRWAEDHPLEFAEWFKEVRPDDYAYLMEENRRGLIHRTLVDYLELEEELRGRLEEEQERHPPASFKSLSPPDYSWDD